MVKLFLIGGCVLFTLDHPVLVALGSLLYFININLTNKEKTMLKDYTSRGIDWLKQLNKLGRDRGYGMKFAREVASVSVEPLLSNLSKEQLEAYTKDELLQHRVSKFIVNELTKEEEELNQWIEDFPVEDNDMIEDYELAFVKKLAPDIDLSGPYTAKLHRQLFKKCKAYYRDIDGSINNELGNRAVLLLEDWFYTRYTRTISELYTEDEEAQDFILEVMFNET